MSGGGNEAQEEHRRAELRPRSLLDMLEHMRTSIDIPDNLLAEAKAAAASENRTLRSLVEEGLRWILSQRKKRGRFQLRDASVGGKGLQPGIREGSWEGIRDLVYQGRGA